MWCIDFKGKFRTKNGVMTLEDAYSRFLLRAEALVEPTGENVERILDGAFQEFGRAVDSWTHWVVRFGAVRLGTFDSERLGRGLRIPRRRRLKPGEVSAM